MSDAERLLERIEDGIVAHGGDLGGWTLRSDETLKLCAAMAVLNDLVQRNRPAKKKPWWKFW
jgi:hypothetical protein